MEETKTSETEVKKPVGNALWQGLALQFAVAGQLMKQAGTAPSGLTKAQEEKRRLKKKAKRKLQKLSRRRNRK